MIYFLDSGDLGNRKGQKQACFSGFPGLDGRKIGVFLWGFLIAENGEAGVSDSPLPFSSVLKGMIGFGSPAVDEICLLKLSLFVGVVELRVCPQGVQQDAGCFAGLVGGVGIACADGHDFLQAPCVQKVSCILVTVLDDIVQCVTGRGCSLGEKVRSWDCVRNYGD